MIDHIGLSVSDYEESKAFYLATLAPLGYALVMEIAEAGPAAGLGAGGKPDFWIAAGAATTPHIHIAFRARDRTTVRAFHEAALAAGAATTARPACARNIIQTTTAPSSSIPMATTSRRSATIPSRFLQRLHFTRSVSLKEARDQDVGYRTAARYAEQEDRNQSEGCRSSCAWSGGSSKWPGACRSGCWRWSGSCSGCSPGPCRRPGTVAVEWPNADVFYRSHRWRRARTDALEGNRERYGALTCECCLTAGHGQWHVDHIRPRSSHPELALDPANLQVLCADCNLGKGLRYATDWRYRGRADRMGRGRGRRRCGRWPGARSRP